MQVRKALPSSPSAAPPRVSSLSPPPPALVQVSCRQPAWVCTEREVLRYYAFYQEPVYEGGGTTVVDDENGFRVRRFTICYFTSEREHPPSPCFERLIPLSVSSCYLLGVEGMGL